ncbi:hypothetical protein GCM10018773_39680 [Streptomyces candidus]|nr:hypothetical protein GCM10018773_39680 [Streptomyces candidus]
MTHPHLPPSPGGPPHPETSAGAPPLPNTPADAPARPDYRPGSADPRLNRPMRERYPQIRATSGYGDPESVTPGRDRVRGPNRSRSAPPSSPPAWYSPCPW